MLEAMWHYRYSHSFNKKCSLHQRHVASLRRAHALAENETGNSETMLDNQPVVGFIFQPPTSPARQLGNFGGQHWGISVIGDTTP
jgi:hypothetical protein